MTHDLLDRAVRKWKTLTGLAALAAVGLAAPTTADAFWVPGPPVFRPHVYAPPVYVPPVYVPAPVPYYYGPYHRPWRARPYVRRRVYLP